ncbi:hypothetical protein [Streptomyces mirabilis]|uniref:hypothetical protein n=1 Tax=Streptomyces mirabilis TaxID=68239 RepID=UPI00366036CD
MLDITYEAVRDLAPGRLAAIDEDRGTIRVQVDAAAPLPDVVRQLNIEIDQLLTSSDWFQLWKDEIVSRNTPDAPLMVVYLLHRLVPGTAVVREDKGCVEVHIDPDLDTKEFAAMMNPATKDFLAGGQWFQLYAGEIIDNSPEPMTQV